MDHNNIQSYIHDAVITIEYHGRSHKFVVFTKNHKWLPLNAAVERLLGDDDVYWKGDIAVMKLGRRDQFVNITSKDKPLSNYAVKR
jgi:hypothetical protein